METKSTPAHDPAIEDVAKGQRLVIYAIALYVGGVLLSAVLPEILLGVVALAGVTLAIMGVLLLAKGLGYSTMTKVLLGIVLFIPIGGLLTLAILSGKATERLRAAGYKVGLFGARGR